MTNLRLISRFRGNVAARAEPTTRTQLDADHRAMDTRRNSANPRCNRLIRVDQLRYFPGVRPLHGPAVHRGVRRLSDSIDGKHGGVHGSAIGLETQRGIIDAPFSVHFDAPLIEFVRHAELEEAYGNRLRTVGEQVQVDVA